MVSQRVDDGKKRKLVAGPRRGTGKKREQRSAAATVFGPSQCEVSKAGEGGEDREALVVVKGSA